MNLIQLSFLFKPENSWILLWKGMAVLNHAVMCSRNTASIVWLHIILIPLMHAVIFFPPAFSFIIWEKPTCKQARFFSPCTFLIFHRHYHIVSEILLISLSGGSRHLFHFVLKALHNI